MVLLLLLLLFPMYTYNTPFNIWCDVNVNNNLINVKEPLRTSTIVTVTAPLQLNQDYMALFWDLASERPPHSTKIASMTMGLTLIKSEIALVA